MKYIKKYENIKPKYKIGDFILIDLVSVKNSNESPAGIKIPIDDAAKIIEYHNEYWPYKVRFLNGETFFLQEINVIKKLTSSQYETHIISRKYNL